MECDDVARLPNQINNLRQMRVRQLWAFEEGSGVEWRVEREGKRGKEEGGKNNDRDNNQQHQEQQKEKQQTQAHTELAPPPPLSLSLTL